MASARTAAPSSSFEGFDIAHSSREKCPIGIRRPSPHRGARRSGVSLPVVGRPPSGILKASRSATVAGCRHKKNRTSRCRECGIGSMLNPLSSLRVLLPAALGISRPTRGFWPTIPAYRPTEMAFSKLDLQSRTPPVRPVGHSRGLDNERYHTDWPDRRRRVRKAGSRRVRGEVRGILGSAHTEELCYSAVFNRRLRLKMIPRRIEPEDRRSTIKPCEEGVMKSWTQPA